MYEPYQLVCSDHFSTPQELTNQQGEIVWRAQHKAWGETQVQYSDWAQHKGIQNPLRFQGQYYDHETGLHYNRYRYYDPLVGRFISKDPIGYAGGLNLYVYAPNPVFWIDPFGLARIKNAIEGERRHKLLNEQLRAKHPEATIQCECYLRDANGKSVRDPDTGERRRIDTAVIENGEAKTYEVTSMTANKDSQMAKEFRVFDAGGTHIRDRGSNGLIPVVGISEILRMP
nr:RHS repeat-associated core domain-containing protein [Pseudomonas laurentiana]